MAYEFVTRIFFLTEISDSLTGTPYELSKMMLDTIPISKESKSEMVKAEIN
jgi:hypothetical protein